MPDHVGVQVVAEDYLSVDSALVAWIIDAAFGSRVGIAPNFQPRRGREQRLSLLGVQAFQTRATSKDEEPNGDSGDEE
jgi:hypothetical protein